MAQARLAGETDAGLAARRATVRVVVVEDHGLFRETLVGSLPGRGGEVVGEAEDIKSALTEIDRAAPDVALLDIRLSPGRGDEGLQLAEILRRSYPDVGLLMLSDYSEIDYVERLLSLEEKSHAIGYLLKQRVGRLAEVVDAIHRVGAGEVIIDSMLIDQLMARKRRVDPLEALTPYERRVLALVAQGRSNLGIAQQLQTKISSVEKHLVSITSKLQLAPLGNVDRRAVNVRVLAVLAFLRSGGTT